MEKIELEIIPENPSKSYSVGETIRGKVRVTSLEEWECAGLELVFGLKGTAHVQEGITKFNLDYQEELTKKTLYQGRWSADVYTYPFEMEVPAGPYTYQGRIINLIRLLKAVARPPSGKSFESEVIPVVVQGIREEGSQEKAKEVIYKESPKGSWGCLIVSLLLFLAGAGAVAWALQSGKDTWLGFAIFLGAVGLVFILINLYMIMVGKKIGMVEARIGSDKVSPGEVVPCSLVFQVNKPVELKGVQVTLTCREKAGNVGIRASKKTFLKVLYEKRQELQLPAKQVPANVPIETRGEFFIPSDAPFSFHLANSLGDGIELEWDVEFRIAMERWPDWFCTEKIIVRPGLPKTETGRLNGNAKS